MPLYKVTITMNLLVVADSPAEAALEARHSARRADGELATARMAISQVSKLRQLGSDEAASCPWAGDGKRTCADYLTEAAK